MSRVSGILVVNLDLSGEKMAKMLAEMTESDWKDEYVAKIEFLSGYGVEVSPFDFYRDLFPVGSLEKKGEKDIGKGNIVATSIRKDGGRSRNWVIYDGLDELKHLIDVPFGLIYPMTHWGRTHKEQTGHELFAFVIDIDFVTLQLLQNLCHQFDCQVQHKPTYLVSSGRGIHLYFFLEKPIPLYKNLREMLSTLKKDLIRRFWNDTTSLTPEKPDIASIYQGFRSVGSWSKLGREYPVRAFKLTEKRFSLDELTKIYTPSLHDVIQYSNVDTSLVEKKPEWKPKKDRIPLEKAKELYPDWYRRKILGEKAETKPKDFWTANKKMYLWWRDNKLRQEIRQGGRYFGVIALCAFGLKCGVEKAQIKADAMGLLSFLDSLTIDKTNPFTMQDINDALTSLDNPLTAKATRQWIEERTKVSIPPNKRNGRTRAEHVKLMNFVRDEINQNKNWHGRKSVDFVVFDFLSRFPNAKADDFVNETGLSRRVFYKYKKMHGK